MAQITLTIDIDDDLVKRVRTAGSVGDEWDADLWEEAETAVLDEIRATFSPEDLLE